MSFGQAKTTVVVTGITGLVGGVIALGIFGVIAAVDAQDTANRHQAQNMSYTLRDCTASPGGDGTQWSAKVMLHNANPDSVDSYGVQVEFLGPDGTPLAWTSVHSFDNLDPGGTKTMTITETNSGSGSPQVTCKPVFYRDGKPAGGLSPVPMK